MLFLIGVFIGTIITSFLEFCILTNKKLKNTVWDNPPSFFGYHIHHSTYGLALIIVSFLFLEPRLLLIGCGVGVILSHTISDKRVVFIEKTKK